MLLRPIALLLALSPVGCINVDWQYTDKRSSGDRATEDAEEEEGEEAGEEGFGTMTFTLADAAAADGAEVRFKLWPVGECEGTEEETSLAAEDFPYTVEVDTACDYKISFQVGDEPSSEDPLEILGEDVADAGEEGLAVELGKAPAGEDEGSENEGAGEETEPATDGETGSADEAGDVLEQPDQEDETVADETPGLREFRIAAGTGRGAWNTRATTVRVKVGDTLRIYNDDSVGHQLHTNGRPCGHGNFIQPGSFGECRISQPFDGSLYDHLTNGDFFISATR